jgi:hypothetical protein
VTDISRSISKADAVKVLEHAGIPATVINEVLEELPDPIDLDRAATVFLRHGLTRDELTSRLGASL